MTIGDPTYQKNVLAYMLRDAEFFGQVKNGISQTHFSDEAAQNLVKLLLDFNANFGGTPGDNIYQVIKSYETAGMLPPARARILARFVREDLFPIPLQNRDYLLKEFDKFLRKQIIKDGLFELKDLHDKDRIDDCEQLVRELSAKLKNPRASAWQASTPKLVELSAVTPRCVLWFWPKRIALGKLTMIAGEPGLGKSYLSMWLIAQATTGRPWPGESNGTLNVAGSAVLLSAEDDLEDTIVPRLKAAGADLTRVNALAAVEAVSTDKQTGERSFNLERDLPALEQAIDAKPDCRLVVVDPISSYVGKTDSHKNAEVRGLLAPLSELAARKRVAVVAITHLNKSSGKKAVDRVTGSGAFVAAARAAWIVSRDSDTEHDRRLFLPIKNNLAKDNDGLAYRLLQSPNDPTVAIVVWDDLPVETTADEAIAENSEDTGSALEKCRQFLAGFLCHGPKSSAEVQEQSAVQGMAWRTIRRAADELRVRKQRAGFGQQGQSFWSLPMASVGQADDSSGQIPRPQ